MKPIDNPDSMWCCDDYHTTGKCYVCGASLDPISMLLRQTAQTMERLAEKVEHDEEIDDESRAAIRNLRNYKKWKAMFQALKALRDSTITPSEPTP